MGVILPDDGKQSGGQPSRRAKVLSRFLPPEHQRPSIGLFLGPFTPAADNEIALWTCIGAQLFSGLALIRMSRRFVFSPDQSVRRFLFKTFHNVVGAALIFGSGLEGTRMLLPEDPWKEEARKARILAQLKGEPVSWWYGPKSFVPSSRLEYTKQMQFHNFEVMHRSPQKIARALMIKDKLKDETNTLYSSIHEKAEQQTLRLSKDLQNNVPLKGVTSYVPQFSTSNTDSKLYLKNVSLKTHADLEKFWAEHNPWDILEEKISPISVIALPKYNPIISEIEPDKQQPSKSDIKFISDRK
ncbi:BA75_02857T0 [Komagataella pastoris]|uniref:BA75_02857T0 n=1 Tax=Komagataella pastoris TaxID=4922 RepID=A0A1B2JBJ3_PICPA|nr:BA75_02857T0 [Komagataella pastoris]